MNSILNVTVESLATHVGIIDDSEGDREDAVRSKILKMQASNLGHVYSPLNMIADLALPGSIAGGASAQTNA